MNTTVLAAQGLKVFTVRIVSSSLARTFAQQKIVVVVFTFMNIIHPKVYCRVNRTGENGIKKLLQSGKERKSYNTEKTEKD